MPSNSISQIDFGDGVLRKVRVQSSGGGITEFVDIPTVEETEFAYDGTQKELVFTGLDTEKVTVSGASATEVGTYTCTLTLKSNSYAWKDLTQETKNIEWEIVDPNHIYGVYWDGSASSLWTRTDDSVDFTDPIPAVNNGDGSSPFDNRMPWSGMQRVEDPEAGTLVSIPKFWYKWEHEEGSLHLQIADTPQEGFHVSPAHADRGDGEGERDVVYVGAYHCASGTYDSTTGVKPKQGIRRSAFRSSIHNLGSTIWQWDYAMWWTICMLYLVEYADWNSQAKIGYGCGNGSSAENSGLCDSMIYHTGTNARNRTTYGHTRYRYIEDLWGNVYDFCDGIYFKNTKVYCIKNPNNFSDTSYGTDVGYEANLNGKYVVKSWNNTSSISGFEYALFPSTLSNDDSFSTYNCDRYIYGSSGVVLAVGGYYLQRADNGLFTIYAYLARTDTYASVGSRLMKLP